MYLNNNIHIVKHNKMLNTHNINHNVKKCIQNQGFKKST